MSRRAEPRPGFLVLSLIYGTEERLAEALEGVSRDVGPVRDVAGRQPFDWTEYYAREMGTPLFRRFAVLAGTWPREILPEAKLRAESIENRLAEGGRRTVNIDPGLLTEESFILATGKNFSHRVYLRDGVYADLTLLFRRGSYEPLPWTYPDYASAPVREFLRGVRADLRRGFAKDGAA